MENKKTKEFTTFMSDGISKDDFEKFTLGICFIAVIAVNIAIYCLKGTTDPNMINLSGLVGGLFVARKGLKYFSPSKPVETKNIAIDATEEEEESIKTDEEVEEIVEIDEIENFVDDNEVESDREREMRLQGIN